MSFKINLIVIITTITVISLSIVFGLFALAANYFSDMTAEARVFFTVYVDGSWTIKIINDFSSEIILKYVSVNIRDVVNELNINVVILPNSLHSINSGDFKTSAGSAGSAYMGVIQINYERNDESFKSTMRVMGSYSELE